MIHPAVVRIRNFTGLIFLGVILAGGVFIFAKDKGGSGSLLASASKSREYVVSDIIRHSDSEAGLSFEYRTAPSGYALKELDTDSWTGEGGIEVLARYAVFRNTSLLVGIPKGNDPEPSRILVEIMLNEEHFTPIRFAKDFYSAKEGSISVESIGRANAASFEDKEGVERHIAVHKSRIFVFSLYGREKDGQIKEDFDKIIDSVKFLEQ